MEHQLHSAHRCWISLLLFALAATSLWAQGQPAQQATNTSAAAPTIEVINDKKRFDLLAAAHTLLVLVKSGTPAAIDAKVIELAGGSVETAAVTFGASKGPFDTGRIVEIPMTIDASRFNRLGPGSVDLTGLVFARASDGKVASVPLSLTLVRQEQQLTSQTTPVVLGIRRRFPFRPVAAVHCIQLRPTPGGAFTAPRVEGGELVAGSPPAAVADTMVTGRFDTCPTAAAAVNPSPTQPGTPSVPPLVVQSTLPAGLTSGAATLRLSGADLKANSTIALQIQAKDAIVWPLLVVLMAVALSRYVHDWVQSGRNASLNLAELNGIADDLQRLEVMKAGTLDQRAVFEVRRLLAEAMRLQEAGDTVAAATSLTNARQKLNELIAGAGPIPFGAMGAMRQDGADLNVVVETPEAERTTTRLLTFSVAGPVPPGLTWEIGTEGAFEALKVIPDPRANPPDSRVSAAAPLREPGVYGIRVTVNGEPEPTTTFRVVPSQRDVILRKVRRIDYSIDLIAAALTALITTVTISELASFGTFRDYVMQFAGAFGITESIKGFANTLAAVRKV